MRRSTNEVIAAYPHVHFSESGLRRLDEVLTFLADLETKSPAFGDRATVEFLSRLAYLNSYGGALGDDDPRRRFQIELSADLGPHDFGVVWRYWCRRTEEYAFFANGGLVWHGGPERPSSLSLEPEMLWGIHT